MTAHLPQTFREFAAVTGQGVPTELVVDSFAGGGGASEGIEAAFRRMRELGLLPDEHPGAVNIAINHDDAALAMHAANHPATLHLPHDVWKVNALKVTNGLPVGLMWASPDCRHHSRAKGGKPVSRSVRDLAWVVAYWAKQVRPRMIFLENVEEFRDWGPLKLDDKGNLRPCPDRKGQTFRKWVDAFVRLGYRVEMRMIRACIYGAPTIRNRLFVIMRCDGEDIVWPEATHGDPKSEAVKAGRLKPWPVAADRLDFSLPCPSILMTREEARDYTQATGVRLVRPLARNTMARLANGVKRYVLDAGDDAFLVTCNHQGAGFRGQGVDEPFATVTRARDAHGVVSPEFAPAQADRLVVPHIAGLAHGDSGGRRSYGLDEPLTTVAAQGNSHALVAPHLMTMRNAGKPFNGADEPAHTVTAGGAGLTEVEAELAPFVSYGQQGGASRPIDDPLHTVTASIKDTNQVVAPYLVPRYGEREGQAPRSAPADALFPTAVPDGNSGSLGAVYLAQHNGDPRRDGEDGARPGRPVDEPGAAITSRATQVQPVVAYLAQHNTDVIGRAADDPASTVMGKGSTQSVVAAMLSHAFTSNTAGGEGDPTKPHKTILAGGNHANLVSLPLVAPYYGSGSGLEAGPANRPSPTVTTKDRFGFVEGQGAVPPLTEAQLASARKVAAFLREFGCWDDRELVTVTIRGVAYVIVDIGMRMLTARELARMQSFPDRYKLAVPYRGGTLSDTEQRHKIGNSVCPAVAEALVFANYRPRVSRMQPVEWRRAA